MILCAMLVAAPPLIEVVRPQEAEVSIAAVVHLPALGARDRAQLPVIARVLPQGSQEYGRREIYQVTDGRTLQCTVLPDALLIRLWVSPADTVLGLRLLNSLLRHPSFPQEKVDTAVMSLERQDRNYWSIALDPRLAPMASRKRDDLLTLFGRIARPERTTVAVVGPFKSGTAIERWTELTADWRGAEEPRYPDDTAETLRHENAGHVTTLELRGAGWPARDASWPTRLLALTALGSGKGAPLYQILRERHGWSYRQEALLWPTEAGWESRLIVAMIPTPEAPKRAEILRTELLDSVRGWREEDRLHALGMAEANLRLGIPFFPLNLAGEPVAWDANDRAAWTAYWGMKTGETWDSETALEAMRTVSLADLQAAATELLMGSEVDILPGD